MALVSSAFSSIFRGAVASCWARASTSALALQMSSVCWGMGPQMKLTARSMLHLRLPPSMSVALPGSKRSDTWGPATSDFACTICDPRPSWPGRGGGERGVFGTRRPHPRTLDRNGNTVPKYGGARGKSNPSRPERGGGGMGGSTGQSMPIHESRRQQRRRECPEEMSPKAIMFMITDCEKLSSLERLSLSHGHLFNHTHVSAMMSRVAKVYERKAKVYEGVHADQYQPLMLELSAAALKHVDLMQPREIANILWAVAKLGGVTDASFVPSWLLAAKEKLPEFNAQDLASTLRDVAKLGIRNEGRDDAFISSWLLAALGKLPEFAAQDLANSLWAAAKLGIRNEAFISRWFLAAKGKLPEFNAPDLAKSLWAAAKLGIRDEAFISSWILAAPGKLPEFNAEGLAKSLWAAAKLDIRDEAFISSWLLAAPGKLPEFNAQELASSLWAAATLGVSDKAFISGWLSAAQGKLHEFDAGELADIRWAGDKMGF